MKEGKEGILHVRKLLVALQDAMSCTSEEAIAELRRVDASGHDVQLRVKGELDVGEFTELVLVIRRQQLDALLTETTAAERRLTELRHRVKREEAQLEQKRVEKGLPADVEAMATLLGAAVAAGDDGAIRVQAHALLAKAKSIEEIAGRSNPNPNPNRNPNPSPGPKEAACKGAPREEAPGRQREESDRGLRPGCCHRHTQDEGGGGGGAGGGEGARDARRGACGGGGGGGGGGGAAQGREGGDGGVQGPGQGGGHRAGANPNADANANANANPNPNPNPEPSPNPNPDLYSAVHPVAGAAPGP